MGEKIIQPPFYNSGFYNAVAGGGGGVAISGYLQITYNYPYIRKGNKFYTCKNLDEIFSGIYNGFNGTNPAAQRYYDGLFGRYYNSAAIPIIDNYLQNNTDGWRVCTKKDIDDLVIGIESRDVIDFNYISSNEMTNKFLLSIQPNGHYQNTTAQQIFDRCYLWTSTKDGTNNYYVQITANNIATVSQYGTGDRYMALRLCKDA